MKQSYLLLKLTFLFLFFGAINQNLQAQTLQWSRYTGHNDSRNPGSSYGTATVLASGGTGTYTYLWSNAATTASITGLTAATYTVTVTDANGCKKTCSSVVGEPACTPPTVGTNTPSAGTCTGATPNNDAQIIFAGFTNADKADQS